MVSLCLLRAQDPCYTKSVRRGDVDEAPKDKPSDDKPKRELAWEAEVKTKVNYAHGRLYLWEGIGDGSFTANGEKTQFTAGRVVGGTSLLIHIDGYGFFEIEGMPLFRAAAELIADAMESGEVKPRREGQA